MTSNNSTQGREIIQNVNTFSIANMSILMNATVILFLIACYINSFAVLSHSSDILSCSWKKKHVRTMSDILEKKTFQTEQTGEPRELKDEAKG